MKKTITPQQKIEKVQEKIKDEKNRSPAFWMINNMPEDLVEERTPFEAHLTGNSSQFRIYIANWIAHRIEHNYKRK